MMAKIRRLLIEAASNSHTPTYSDVALKIGFVKNRWGFDKTFYKLLEDLGSEELKNGRPLLNALIVRKIQKTPGNGFYRWYKKNIDNRFDISDIDSKKKLFINLKIEAIKKYNKQ